MNSKPPIFSVEKMQELAARKIAENAEKWGSQQPAPSVPINFSVELHELITSAESNPENAMLLLQKAAASFRQGAPLHPMLAAYLADAIELAAAKPLAFQARALTDELHLTSPNRRPAQSWLLIGHAFAMQVSAGASQTKTKVDIAVEYGIDETTALKYYKEYRAQKAKHDSIE